ncbi:MAG TPA: dihydrolipoamide acetyltransferase family protein [Gemmata sp.]|nr:dihydrolipoamide acetyltransferase family protein [Gemmata sp.]
MPVPITIPRLGWNMDEGIFVEWLKADGEPVRAGEAVFRLEGEKATEEIESLDAGTLHIPAAGPNPGDRLKVGAVIGYLLQAGEVVSDVSGPGQAVGVSPLLAPHESLKQIPQVAHAPRSPGTAITPRARRLAARLGVQVEKLSGSGRNGRIRERDVASASSAKLIPITPLRRTIATRMVESRQTTAPVTLLSQVDATSIVAARERLKRSGNGELIPSYTDILVKLAAFALQKHPELAARWTDAALVLPQRIDIGIAVDTDAGLLVPVIRDVPALGMTELAARSRDLIARARAGKLVAGDLQGGCFTITNLGSFGIDAFTPIINPPESAVLGVGRIARQPVMDGDRVVGRDMVWLSLTFDHRVVDGAPAARFLQTLSKLIANPGEHLK